MRKVIVAALMAIMALSIAGCENGKSTTEAVTEVATEDGSTSEESTEENNVADMEGVYSQIKDKVQLPEMITMDEEFVDDYYGIDCTLLDEYLFVSAKDAGIKCDTIMLVKVKENSNTDKLKSSFEAIVTQKKAEMKDYLPEQYAIVEKSKIEVSGDYVYLIISEDVDDIQAIVDEYVK